MAVIAIVDDDEYGDHDDDDDDKLDNNDGDDGHDKDSDDDVEELWLGNNSQCAQKAGGSLGEPR